MKEVVLTSLTFKSKPHCRQCDIWLGGELAKEVVFIHVFVITFEQAHFGMFSGLLVIIIFFVKLLYYTAYFVKKLHPNIYIFFCVFPSLQFENMKHCLILLMLDWFHA